MGWNLAQGLLVFVKYWLFEAYLTLYGSRPIAGHGSDVVLITS